MPTRSEICREAAKARWAAIPNREERRRITESAWGKRAGGLNSEQAKEICARIGLPWARKKTKTVRRDALGRFIKRTFVNDSSDQ